jgi:hypothetical protein
MMLPILMSIPAPSVDPEGLGPFVLGLFGKFSTADSGAEKPKFRPQNKKGADKNSVEPGKS